MRLHAGDQTEDVDLIILLLMGDQANATQLQMKTRRAPAAPQKDGAETGMVTANVMNAVTSGCLVSTSLGLPASPLISPSEVSKMATHKGTVLGGEVPGGLVWGDPPPYSRVYLAPWRQ